MYNAIVSHPIPFAMALAFLLDRLLGDPPWLPHPIRLIGLLISRTEKKLRIWLPQNLKWAGFFLWVATVGTTFLVTWALCHVFFRFNFWLGWVVESALMYTALASKCLEDEGKKVYQSIQEGDLAKSRLQISYLVGRDTADLSFAQILRATVETIAENTVDAVVAPLLYGILGGAPLMMAYKAVNTLDSMVGYKNERFKNMGFFSAKADDVWNYIPARISLPFFTVSAAILKLHWKKAWSITWRDRKNHKSPNCAWPEAAVAGALGIQLGGNNRYFGEVVEKPTIGDATRPLEDRDIVSSMELMRYVGRICLMVLIALRLGYEILY